MYFSRIYIALALLLLGNQRCVVLGDENSDSNGEMKITFLDLRYSLDCATTLFINKHGAARLELKSFQKQINLSDGCIILNERLLLISKRYKIPTNMDAEDSLWLRNFKQFVRVPEKQPESDSYFALPYILFFLPTVVFCSVGIVACVYFRYSMRT